MKIDLPQTVSSTEDLMALTLEIREYATWFSQTANAARAGVSSDQKPQPQLSPAALDVLRQAKGDAHELTPDLLDSLTTLLDRMRAHAKTMTITLAAPATNEVKNELVAWMRANIAPDVLITFRFNSLLLGGMVVRFGSRIFDWSFRRTILNERHRVGEVLRNV